MCQQAVFHGATPHYAGGFMLGCSAVLYAPCLSRLIVQELVAVYPGLSSNSWLLFTQALGLYHSDSASFFVILSLLYSVLSY